MDKSDENTNKKLLWSDRLWCDQPNIFDSPIIPGIRGINYRGQLIVVRQELSHMYVEWKCSFNKWSETEGSLNFPKVFLQNPT